MRALYICGSINQTRMVHQVARQLPQFEAYFTPYYYDGFKKLVCRAGLLDFTVMGGQFLQRTLKYLETHRLALDLEGRNGPYDLVVTCSDLIVPRNIVGPKLVLVQEGMTDSSQALTGDLANASGKRDTNGHSLGVELISGKVVLIGKHFHACHVAIA